MSEQAKRAYLAFWHHLDGEIPGDWENLTETERESWRAAVVAAVDAPAPKETLTDVQVRLLEEMGTVDVARKLKAMMPPDRGFLLFTADYGRGGNLAYVSTVDRDDAIRMVREWLKKQGAIQ